MIWANLGVSDFTIYTRKLITYLVTLILLGLSFAAVYGLSIAQYNSQLASASDADAGTDYLSILISIVISLINVVLGQVIRRLSIFERDYTETYHQTSLAIKSVTAQLINSIFVPIMSNWFIKGNNLYDDNGLADEIFLLGLTTAFIAPGLKVVEPAYYVGRVLAWWFRRPCNILITQPTNSAKTRQNLTRSRSSFSSKSDTSTSTSSLPSSSPASTCPSSRSSSSSHSLATFSCSGRRSIPFSTDPKGPSPEPISSTWLWGS